MKLKKIKTFIMGCYLLLSAFGLVLPADGAVVFDNGGPDLNLNGVVSDTKTGPQWIADDFSFNSPTQIDGIRFWGVYSGNYIPTADDFTITFYGDNGSSLPDPANIIATYSLGDISRTDTGDTVTTNMLNLFLFETTFSPVVFGSAQYWVSIYNNTSSTPAGSHFAWFDSSYPGNATVSFDYGGSWNLMAGGSREAAFQLTTVVPEPISAILFIAGGATLGIRRFWKKRRKA